MKHLILSFVVVVLFSSCGSKGTSQKASASSSGNVAAQESDEQILSSTQWQSDCMPDADSGYHVRKEDKYRGDSYVWDTLYFLDTQCSELVIRETIEGRYKIGEQLQDETYEFDYSISSYSMTFGPKELVSSVNADAYCGITDWRPGVKGELQGSKCGFPSSRIDSNFSSVVIQGEQIFHAGTDGVTSKNNRNMAINWDEPYQRVQ